MVFDGAIWAGVALLIGSLIGFAGGSGMRGAFYRGQKSSAVVIGAALALAGMALVFYSDVTVGIFGAAVSGALWVLLGFGIGFFAARAEDAGVQFNSHESEDEVALGTIAAIAAGLAAGRLTPEQAEKQIRASALVAPNAPALWQSMSAEEREELGLNFMRLAASPEFSARIEKQLEPLKNVDPELWKQSLAKARDELGTSPEGNDC
jgi:vacuolar-type H+-ATPase subunit I/STV1